MARMIVAIGLWWLCSATLIVGVPFNLTFTRIGNNFTLTCETENATTTPEGMHFWINETEQIDIAKTLNGSVHEGNVISFELVPQYEGTFFCGESDGEWSNGIGPFAGEIDMPFKFYTTHPSVFRKVKSIETQVRLLFLTNYVAQSSFCQAIVMLLF